MKNIFHRVCLINPQPCCLFTLIFTPPLFMFGVWWWTSTFLIITTHSVGSPFMLADILIQEQERESNQQPAWSIQQWSPSICDMFMSLAHTAIMMQEPLFCQKWASALACFTGFWSVLKDTATQQATAPRVCIAFKMSAKERIKQRTSYLVWE